MKSDSANAVAVAGLKKAYGKTQALAGLDFEMPVGAITGFLGPNGAGKTTTFRALLGLTRFDAGEVEVLGHPIPGDLLAVTKKVGAIVEEPGLIKALNGRVNLRVAADQLGFGHEKIEGMLDFVGLTADAGRKVSEYSKGMRQRLALAAALIGDPELLVLDEPLDGLDPSGQKVFRAKLRAIADSGQTVIVSSHDMSDVEALADYVVVIDHGRLVTQGSIEQLLDGGGTRVKVPNPDRAIGVLAAAGIEASYSDGAVVALSGDGAAIVEILAMGQIYPSEVIAERATLESFFLGMTSGGDITPEDVR